MNQKIKTKISHALVKIARAIGPSLKDPHTGEVIGRGLVVGLGSKVWVIGVQENVVPVFRPQSRLTYWRQEVCFSRHPPVDYPRE
ncbi:MAG TPA: hypothetical protein PJ991_02530 [Kiritimatiellia bacterium]|nr:hypothetical protein [Kiritimatiellia bacterium]